MVRVSCTSMLIKPLTVLAVSRFPSPSLQQRTSVDTNIGSIFFPCCLACCSIKTVSTTPGFQEDCWTGATYLQSLLRNIGADTKLVQVRFVVVSASPQFPIHCSILFAIAFLPFMSFLRHWDNRGRVRFVFLFDALNREFG